MLFSCGEKFADIKISYVKYLEYASVDVVETNCGYVCLEIVVSSVAEFFCTIWVAYSVAIHLHFIQTSNSGVLSILPF